MPIKSAEEYREDARRIRALSEAVTTPGLRETSLDVATTYDMMARRADDLAKAKSQSIFQTDPLPAGAQRKPALEAAGRAFAAVRRRSCRDVQKAAPTLLTSLVND